MQRLPSLNASCVRLRERIAKPVVYVGSCDATSVRSSVNTLVVPCASSLPPTPVEFSHPAVGSGLLHGATGSGQVQYELKALSHSSGMPFELPSPDVPFAMSTASSTPFELQS